MFFLSGVDLERADDLQLFFYSSWFVFLKPPSQWELASSTIITAHGAAELNCEIIHLSSSIKLTFFGCLNDECENPNIERC